MTNNTEIGNRRTIENVYAAMGLAETFAQAAINRKCIPIPRNRRHYRLENERGDVVNPAKTIDEALEICQMEGVSGVTELILRQGLRLPSGAFLKDVYGDDTALEHEPLP